MNSFKRKCRQLGRLGLHCQYHNTDTMAKKIMKSLPRLKAAAQNLKVVNKVRHPAMLVGHVGLERQFA